MIKEIYIKVNGYVFNMTLAENSATKTLVEKLRNGDITVSMHDYGGFEKVGGLGFSLPTSNSQITTTRGDVMLYVGDQIVIFYESNSWSYTRLGRITNLDDLEEALGSGNCTITLSLDEV